MVVRRTICVLLAVLLIVAGLFMAYRALMQMRGSIISQHAEKLTDVVNSIDRSAESIFHIYRESLQYVAERRGFIAAENTWKETGDSEDLMFRMKESLLTRELKIKTVLAIDRGTVLLSTDGNTEYKLPDLLPEVFVCRDNEQGYYLGISYSRKPLTYAVLVDMSVLCDYLAESSAVNEADRMLLIDYDGELMICRREGTTVVQPLTEELIAKSPARKLAKEAVGTDNCKVDLFQAEEKDGAETVGYALIGNEGSRNGFFTICVLDEYDPHLRALKEDSLRLVVWCGFILLGLAALIFYVSSVSHKTQRAEKEVARLKEQQAALEKINEQTQQLAHHQRLETIGTLTSSISHEFNNLLTPIMSYSLLTLEKLPSEEVELYDNVLEIYNASQKAKVIISRLSDLSRKNSPKTFRQVSVDELVKKALDIAMPAKPEGGEVKLNLNCRNLRITANEIQICQMLLNLILNAFQAMEEGGVLKIDTNPDDDCIQLHITDTGAGIPEEIRKKIFDPFFTTKESGKGTGLGLAIVAQVVEDHKGTIEVSDAEGGGTCFEVRLPRQTEVR